MRAVGALCATLGCVTGTPLHAQVAAMLAGTASLNGLEDERSKSLACMTDAIAYEAGMEPLPGKEAVAQVILNRMRNPAYPKTICGVVYQGSERRTGCQFTFTCDGSMRRRLSVAVMASARAVAESVISGVPQDHVAGAMFYHAYYVSPRWAPRLTRVTQIGAHIFYRPGAGQEGPAWVAPPAERAGGGTRSAPAQFAPWGLPLNSGG